MDRTVILLPQFYLVFGFRVEFSYSLPTLLPLVKTVGNTILVFSGHLGRQ